MATFANRKSSGKPTDIGRRGDAFDYAADTVANLSTIPVIQFEPFSGIGIINPSGSGVSTVQPYVSDSADATFVPLKDAGGSDVILSPAEGTAQEFGEIPFVWQMLKLVGDAAGTVKVQLKG